MDVIDPIRVLLSLGLVIGLIGMFALALRMLAKKKPTWLPNVSASTRLRVLESRMLDTRHKLVLVARDDQEYLLLVSSQNAQLIEKIESKPS